MPKGHFKHCTPSYVSLDYTELDKLAFTLCFLILILILIIILFCFLSLSFSCWNLYSFCNSRSAQVIFSIGNKLICAFLKNDYNYV